MPGSISCGFVVQVIQRNPQQIDSLKQIRNKSTTNKSTTNRTVGVRPHGQVAVIADEHATLCVTADALQTKVDAHCSKLATVELS